LEENKNILLLTSPAPLKSGFSVREKRPPLGVGYLISVLRNNNYNVYFNDQYLQKNDILNSPFLLKHNIDVIGIYSNTVCFQGTLDLLAQLKSQDWKGKIIIGGPHTSVGSDMFSQEVDYIVIGEGEITLLDILQGKVDERIVQGKKVENLDTLPRLPWEDFMSLPYHKNSKWLKSKKNIVTLNTSRGCPFNCTFCSVKSIWGREYRCMSANRIIDEIEFLIKKYSIDGIYFREDHFTFNKQRTIDFCELLLKKNINIDWLCETRVDDLDDLEYQKLLAKAGCKVFYIGVESGSPRMLKFYKKGETVEQFIKAFDNAKKAGITTYASLITGIPGETKEDKQLTKVFLKRIQPDFITNNYYVGMPGSEIYNYLYDNKLYEYMDCNRILYPKGFWENNKQHKDKLVYNLKDIEG